MEGKKSKVEQDARRHGMEMVFYGREAAKVGVDTVQNNFHSQAKSPNHNMKNG